MRRLLLALAGVLTLAGSATSVAAAGPTWTALQLAGPARDRAQVWQLAANPANPQQLVAATSSGVWLSGDGGQSWQPSAIHTFAWSVVYSGSDIYVGTARKGIYISSDGGQQWAQQNSGLRSLDVRSIAVGPTAIVLGTALGVYISGSGQGWQAAGLQVQDISSVAIIGNNPLAVMAGADGQVEPSNLFKNMSVGAGGGWQSLNGGDPQGSPVFSVAVSPQAQGSSAPTVLVGNLRGLYRTTNLGVSWQSMALAGSPQWSVNAIAFDPQNPSVVYVGGDNGGSAGGGLERSTDGGNAWSVLQTGLPTQDVTSLIALNTKPLSVLASLWNASTRRPAAASLVDSTVPGPVPLVASSGPRITVHVSPVATPPPAQHQVKPAVAGSSLPGWMIPGVVIAAIVVVLLMTAGVRRRRARLDAEAPP